MAERRVVKLPSWALYGLLGLVLVGALVHVASGRPGQTARAAPSVTEAREPVVLPPQFRRRLRQKIELLIQDLRLQRDNPWLLGRLAESYLALAVLERAENRRTSERCLQAASTYAGQLRRISPVLAANLTLKLRAPERLEWSTDPEPIISQARYAVRSVPYPRDAPATGDAAPRPPNGPGMILEPEPAAGRAIRNGPASVTLSGNGPRMPAPAFSSFDRAGGGQERPSLEDIRQRMRLEATSIEVADELGRALEGRAATVRRGPRGDPLEPDSRRYLEEAAQVYLEGLRRSRLRIHKTAFCLAAAQVYFKLHDWEKQYRLLKQAVRHTPFAPVVWHELHAVCLRTGRTEESQLARQSQADWTLPNLRLP
jgi:tetratricopeptide (TPR) repeat protein